MSFFDDIADFFSSDSESLPSVDIPEVDLSEVVPEADWSFSDLLPSADWSFSDLLPDSFSSASDAGMYYPEMPSYDANSFLNTDGFGYDTPSMDRLVAQLAQAPSIPESMSTAQLDGFSYPAEDLTKYLAPTSELANISNPIEQALKLQSAGVYGMSPDTGASYTTDYLTGATAPSVPAPEYWGTGSDSFNQYYDPQTGVVPTNAGIPMPSASWLTSLLKSSGQGNKSMLQSGLGAALMVAQIAGALQGNKGSRGNKGSNDDDAEDMVTAQQAEQKITQTPTTPMTWVTPGTNRANGGPIYGRTRPKQGALGLLRGAQAGQEDGVPINASHGEYVFDADTVSALGDGNTEAGAKRLDEMRQRIRTHKRSAPATKIPPKAKPAASYLAGRK